MTTETTSQITWTCNKCKKTFGPERYQHDQGLCIRCSPYKNKEESEAYHINRVMNIRKILESRKEDGKLSCKVHGRKYIETSIGDDEIVIKCYECGFILKKEARMKAKERCITCGRDREVPRYSPDEYEIVKMSHLCPAHGVEGSIDEHIEIRNLEKTLTNEGLLEELIDCRVRQNICHMQDQWLSVKIGVFKWLKEEIQRNVGEEEFKKLLKK